MGCDAVQCGRNMSTLLKTQYSIRSCSNLKKKRKVKQSAFQEAEASRFHYNRRIKVVRLSSFRTGRLYPSKYSRYSFLLENESTPGPQCGRKNYVNDRIRNRTRDLPACSAVPQPTAPLRAPGDTLITDQFNGTY